MNNRISPFANLAGRVVIVTGAAAGIGLGLSYAFAEQGCQLVLLDVNEPPLTEVAKRIEKSGTQITVAGSVPEGRKRNLQNIAQRITQNNSQSHTPAQLFLWTYSALSCRSCPFECCV
jgi:NAD(P)-dependent dehydrogenase (short-subunit alcohol dehydrogenase family)